MSARWSIAIFVLASPLGAAVAQPCSDPDLARIPTDVELKLCDGTKKKGLLVIKSCSADGETGCLATVQVPALEKAAVDPSLFSTEDRIAGVKGALPACDSDGSAGCLTTPSFPAVDTTSLNPAEFATGLTIGGVTGTYVPVAPCNADGQIGCRANVAFPTVEKSAIDPRFVKKGVTLGGVTGRRQEARFCRNSANLTIRDASEAVNLPRPVTLPGAVNISLDRITMPDAHHRLSVGSPLRFTSTGTLPGGIVAGTTYYAILPGGTALKIAETPLLAAAGTAIDLTTTGSGSMTVMSAPNGIADIWDNIDDDTSADQSGLVSVFGDALTTHCGRDMIVDVTNSEPGLTPPQAVPEGGANLPFTTIYEETLTGVRLTNILYDGTGTIDWTKSHALCAEIDSGDGRGKWRLPTQKELLTFYHSGGAPYLPAPGPFWAGTTVSIALGKAFSTHTSSGYTNNYWYDADKFLTTNRVVCARWE